MEKLGVVVKSEKELVKKASTNTVFVCSNCGQTSLRPQRCGSCGSVQDVQSEKDRIGK